MAIIGWEGIQRALIARGFDVGPSGADGQAGPATRSAIWEAIKGLPEVVPVGHVTSDAGRKFITKWEGVRLRAYQDGGGVWTIGVGHTSAAGPPKVVPGMTITMEESDAILSRDLKTFENVVNKAAKVTVNQNMFDAMTSLAFNIGGGAFARSTLVKKLNAGDYQGAANQFLVWVKDNGQVVQGLVNRRKAERSLFLKK